MSRYLLAMIVCFSLASVALADENFAPPWRAQPEAAYARWEFDTQDANPAPDAQITTLGPPSCAITTPQGLNDWLPVFEGRPGVWDLTAGGQIVATMPNLPEPRPYKDIWFQLTWYNQGGRDPLPVIDIVPDIGQVTFLYIADQIFFPDNWVWQLFHANIEPNPNTEDFIITGDILVDELVIDTYCVPEPATMGLLSLGGVVLMRRKK